MKSVWGSLSGQIPDRGMEMGLKKVQAGDCADSDREHWPKYQ